MFAKFSVMTCVANTLWGIKTHQNFFNHNLEKCDPILISFGKLIFDTTGHQMIV